MAKLDAALIYILFIQHSLIVSGWPVSRSCKPVILGDDRTFNSVLNGTIVERELFHQLGGSKRKLRRSLSKVTEKIENKFTEEPNLVLSSEAPKLNRRIPSIHLYVFFRCFTVKFSNQISYSISQ